MSNFSYLNNYDTSKNKKPTKRELYQQKLKEREIFTNNFFDKFNDIGGGAPLRNKDGTVQTTRVSMLNQNYEDLINKQNYYNNYNFNNYNNNNYQNYNHYNNNY